MSTRETDLSISWYVTLSFLECDVFETEVPSQKFIDHKHSMSLCKESSQSFTKLTTKLLVLDVESESLSRDQSKSVCIAIGSPRRPLRELIGQNNSGTFAGISNVRVAPFIAGKRDHSNAVFLLIFPSQELH